MSLSALVHTINHYQEFKLANMTTEKKDWGNIPPLEGLSVDWDYATENSVEKREWTRITKDNLIKVFGGQAVRVKIVSRVSEDTGYVIDIARKGLGIIIDSQVTVGEQIKLGFLLGEHKIISKAIVKNIGVLAGKQRIGVEFVNLDPTSESRITETIKLFEMENKRTTPGASGFELE